jgi:outer membrane lipoprotein carrier protein
MKRINLLVLLFVAGVTTLTGQQDPVAGKILDRFSEKALSAPSVTMSFDLTIIDATEQTEETIEGRAVIRKGMYMLELPDNIIWFNGEAIWTLTPDVQEVTITEPDIEDETFISNPETLFTLYREGYKYRFIEDSPSGSIIDLYPEDLSAEFSRIRLIINKEANLGEAEYVRKDGITLFLVVKSYDLRKEYADGFFSFDAAKYPDVEIIDMR